MLCLEHNHHLKIKTSKKQPPYGTIHIICCELGGLNTWLHIPGEFSEDSRGTGSSRVFWPQSIPANKAKSLYLYTTHFFPLRITFYRLKWTILLRCIQHQYFYFLNQGWSCQNQWIKEYSSAGAGIFREFPNFWKIGEFPGQIAFPGNGEYARKIKCWTSIFHWCDLALDRLGWLVLRVSLLTTVFSIRGKMGT